jgi:hypothetical protein
VGEIDCTSDATSGDDAARPLARILLVRRIGIDRRTSDAGRSMWIDAPMSLGRRDTGRSIANRCGSIADERRAKFRAGA